MKPVWVWFLACGGAWAQGSSPPVAAFDWEQRWQHYVYRTYSWQRLSLLAVDSGVDHVLGEPREWGRGPYSFGYRFAAGFGKRVVRNSIELGAGAALREDLRFRPSRDLRFRGRIRHAFLQAFAAYQGEHMRFGYSRLASTTGGVLTGSLWDPCPLTAGRFFERVGSGYLGHLENSFLAEFEGDMKAMGRRVRRAVLRK